MLKDKLLMFRILLLLVILFTALASKAKQPVIWATEAWPNFSETNGNGLYHEIMKAVFEPRDFNLVINYVPWKRSLFKVEHSEADITGAMPKNETFYFSQFPILKQPKSILFSNPLLNNVTLDQLSNYIGTWGNNYEDVLFSDADKDYFKGFPSADRDAALKLVVHGRADYYLDARTLIELSLVDLNKNMPEKKFQIHDIGYFELFMVFSKNAKGREMKSIFDKGIKRLLDSGKLESLYLKYNVPFPY